MQLMISMQMCSFAQLITKETSTVNYYFSPIRSKIQVLTKSSRVEFARCIASSPTRAMSSKLVSDKPASSLLSQSSCKGLSTKFWQRPAKTLQILIKILIFWETRNRQNDIQNISLSFKHLSQYSKAKKSHIFGGMFVLENGINLPFIFF